MLVFHKVNVQPLKEITFQIAPNLLMQGTYKNITSGQIFVKVYY